MASKQLTLLMGAVAVAAVVAFLPMTSGAYGEPSDGPEMIDRLDVDGDGFLSPSEFPGPEEMFEDLDTDGDGLLSEQEVLASRPAPPEGPGGFENDDADNDGQVTREEFSGPQELFDHLDADGDGIISRAEVGPGLPPGGPPPVEAESGDTE